MRYQDIKSRPFGQIFIQDHATGAACGVEIVLARLATGRSARRVLVVLRLTGMDEPPVRTQGRWTAISRAGAIQVQQGRDAKENRRGNCERAQRCPLRLLKASYLRGRIQCSETGGTAAQTSRRIYQYGWLAFGLISSNAKRSIFFCSTSTGMRWASSSNGSGWLNLSGNPTFG